MPVKEKLQDGPSKSFDASEEIDLREVGGSTSREFNLSIATSTLAAAYSRARLKAGSTGANQTTLDAATVTIAALKCLAPADEIEALLASQAVAAHAAGLEALRRAAHPAGEDVATMLDRAASLGQLMLDTLTALERRRAARQQPKAEPEPVATDAKDMKPAPAAPPPPPMTSPAARTEPEVDEPVALTNEQLSARGYRSTGIGYGRSRSDEAAGTATP